ncbi:MAG: SGNH/GDSL hydrolase family protein [Proteobacteria bacterium]|nr:SGNH/GDSL hydrolase family protein [Pseudomonadota bacterium]
MRGGPWGVLLAAVVVAGVAREGGALAAAEDARQRCAAPAGATFVDQSLRFAAGRMKAEGVLKIVVLGTASAAGAGVSEAGKAYPARLETELSGRLAGVWVTVATTARRGWTAREMAEALASTVIPGRASLVVWQTGTVDAIRGLDPIEFGNALIEGIERLHSASIDVILVDQQYSPRTAAMINLAPYQAAMERVAQNFDVLLFRRHDLMQHWTETGFVDLSSTAKAEQQRVADIVHGCVAALLAEMIGAALAVDAAGAAKP